MTTAQQEEKDKKQSVSPPYLSVEEIENLRFWQTRAQKARDMRDLPHREFDSMTFQQYLESNERLWNATIEPKTDPRDWQSRVRKRTVFSKGNAILGRLMEENFMSEFSAVDEDNLIDVQISRGLTDAVEASKRIEKSQYIEYMIGQEMLKHGFVFVQETFEVSDRVVKKFLNDSDDPFQRRWTKGSVEPYKREAKKRLLRPDSVYLGDISKIDIEEQPYIVIRTKQNFEVAKSIFSSLPRWQYVKPGYAHTSTQDQSTYLDDWRMGVIEDNEVEIVECQDPWNDEYQILIQGIPMLPVGYPIPWQCKGYNVRMRGVFIINPQFAYCHGLSHVMRSDSETRDFLLRYMTNRSLQDLLQPMVSAAQKTLTSVIFMPGRITHNLKPEDVKPLLQGQLPQSAIQMYELFEKNLDEDSISKIVAGQEPSGDPTAYQISVQQKMAARALGPIVFNFMWLLQDMDFLRAQTILEFISKPKSTMIDPVSKEVIATYNSLMLEDADVGEGVIGNHLIKFQPTSKHPSELEVLKEEDELSNFEGKQMRVSYLDGEAVRNLRYKITNTVKSSPRKNSDTNKILFGNFMDNAMNYFGGTVNLSYLQNEFARVWEKDPEKVFNQNVQPVPQVATKQPTGSQQVKNKVVAGVVNDSVV